MATIEFLPLNNEREMRLVTRNTGNRRAMVRDLDFVNADGSAVPVNRYSGDVIEPGSFDIKPISLIDGNVAFQTEVAYRIEIVVQQFDGTTNIFSHSFTLP